MIINRRYDYKYELSLNKSRRDDMIIEGNQKLRRSGIIGSDY